MQCDFISGEVKVSISSLLPPLIDVWDDDDLMAEHLSKHHALKNYIRSPSYSNCSPFTPSKNKNGGSSSQKLFKKEGLQLLYISIIGTSRC